MNKTPNDQHPSSNLTKVIWWLSTLVFLLTEAIVVVTIFKHHNDGSPLGYVNRLGIPLVVSLPWALGMRGYSRVMSQLAASTNECAFATVLVARQFLYTEIAAYMMLSFFWSALAK